MPRRAAPPADRVRSLIALDAASVMRRLRSRREEMIRSFSRKRDRRALLSVIHSWFDTARFDELVELEVAEQAAASGFYEALSDLGWYFEHTEDMPGTAERVVDSHLKRLDRAHRALAAALGGDKAARRPAARKAPARKPAREAAARKTTRKPAAREAAARKPAPRSSPKPRRR